MPKATEQQRYWLSYDLGLRGKYDALYEWLDQRKAEECGDSVATFISTSSTKEIKEELLELLGTTKVRIYLVNRHRGGTFLLGKRKAAPWAGYFESAIESALDA